MTELFFIRLPTQVYSMIFRSAIRDTLSIGMSAVFVLYACSPGSDRQRTSDRDVTPDSVAASDSARRSLRPGIRFDPPSTQKGARIGDLVVDSIQAQLAAVDSVWVGTARFSGELQLRGNTMRHFEPDARAVCFEADSASAARLPRWQGDERRPWFCLENTAEAARTLAAPGEERPATIVIDRFTINRGLSDQVNSAKLVRVVERFTPDTR